MRFIVFPQLYVEKEAILKCQPQLGSAVGTSWRELGVKIYNQSFPVRFPKHFSFIP